jgi:hypothetical protein
VAEGMPFEKRANTQVNVLSACISPICASPDFRWFFVFFSAFAEKYVYSIR